MTADPKDRMRVEEGDITKLAVDAIVNAANDRLLPGGGVCGAIHGAAGPELERECHAIGACPTGEARITGGHDLPAAHVIHAVGPVWEGGGANEDGLLASCYRNAIALAEANSLRSIAFPAISTGIYGFPAARAAGIAVAATRAALADAPGVESVIFCCFSADSAALHRQALAGL